MIQKRKSSTSLVKRVHSADNVTRKTHKILLPHHATLGNTQNHDHKLSVSSKVILEHISISVIIQSIFIAFQNIVLPSKSRIRPYFLFITLSANRYTRVPRVCGQRSAGFLSKAFARSIASSTWAISI